MTHDQQEAQVKLNSKEFDKLLPELLADENLLGKFALMREGKIEAHLTSFNDAIVMGEKLFGGKPYSVQQIIDKPINLGSYSYFR